MLRFLHRNVGETEYLKRPEVGLVISFPPDFRPPPLPCWFERFGLDGALSCADSTTAFAFFAAYFLHGLAAGRISLDSAIRACHFLEVINFGN
jgi:hypothetical protein